MNSELHKEEGEALRKFILIFIVKNPDINSKIVKHF